MKIGICDDEKGTCAAVEEMIYRFFSDYRFKLEIDVWYNGEDCMRDMSRESYDLLFLDIELPGNNGVDVGKYLREINHDKSVQIIYISSKTNYAMELFQVHPYDFLVKPISYQNISDVLTKVMDFNESDSRRFRYSQNRVEKSVLFKDIVYLSSRGRYIELHMNSGQKDEFIGKLSLEKEKLPEEFAAVGKSYVVNLRYVKMYGGDYLETVSGEKINITAPYRKEFRNLLFRFNEGGGAISG